MLERDIEELIAKFPDDFFPNHGFVLKGRQQVFSGVGRFDLLFMDRHGTNILMELKAVTAKYENATQLAKYKEALEAIGERNILMWLVAPLIPTAVREFMDRIGIEYSEIHEAQVRRVADRHGVSIASPPVVAIQSKTSPSANSQAIRGAGTPPERYQLLSSIDKEKLAQLIQDFESVVRRRIDRSLAVKLREEIIMPQIPSIKRDTVLQLARWCKTDRLYRDGMVVAQKISMVLFGEILDRHKLGT